MISHLHIEGIAVIKSTDILFSSGFNVLTGETGAGKSIIIAAINAIFGGRLNRDMIREGCERAFISAVINEISDEKIKFINDLGYETEDNTILLHRELTRNGKNICKINGRPATVAILRQLKPNLIDVCSQHEGYHLLSGENHIKYVDLFGKISNQLTEYKNVYSDMINIKKKIQEFTLDECEVQRKTELLQYEINEIEDADVKEGESEKLIEIKKKYNNRQKTVSSLTEARKLLNGDEMQGGALEGIQKSAELLFEVSEYIKEADNIAQRLQNAFYDVSECLNEMSVIIDETEYNPQELEWAEERLDVLYKLKRKYGKNEEEILNFLKCAQNELFELKNCEDKVHNLETEFNRVKKIVEEKGKEISVNREKYGKELAKKVENELKFLDMPNVEFTVEQEITSPGINGCDKIRFFICVNEGESLRPIESVASGGELSRILLGIKNTVFDGEENTVIFDEIDTGVSGNAANKIGLKLKELSKKKQVICITHLAQIASLADEHFLIKKKSENGRTDSSVCRLDFGGRKRELARIMGGINISESTLKAAEEMINSDKVPN